MQRRHCPERRLRRALLPVVVLLLLLAGCSPQTDQSASPGNDVIETNNRGVGEMGHFNYARARSTFESVVAQAPEWIPGRINLAIATLNRQEPGDEARALEELNRVLAEEPDNLRARYVAGLLLFNAGEIEAALEHFSRVRGDDPGDAYAAYYAGQSLLQLGRPEEAMAAFEAAMEADPYLRSAFYGGFLAAQRMGERERARELLGTYERLERDPRSRLAEIKYTRMGPKAEARAFRDVQATVGDYETPPLLTSLSRPLVGDVEASSVLTAVPRIQIGGKSLLLVFDDASGTQLVDLNSGSLVHAPFTGDRLAQAAAWGDFDNDGVADLYVGRNGDNRLWHAGEDGSWREVAVETGTALEGTDSRDVLFVDADHDGDLDLFVVNANGPDELLNNNGDGSFRPLAADSGLAGDGATRRVLAYDFDQDRDVDLVVLRETGSPIVYVNDRLWNYRRVDGPKGFAGIVGVAVDIEADGSSELCGPVNGRLSCWTYADGWQPGLDSPVTGEYREMAILDTNADGRWEFLLADEEGWVVVETDPLGRTVQSGKGAVQAVIHPEAGAGPALVISEGAGLKILGPVPGPFVSLAFTGREEAGESMRSNRSGLGTRFVVRAGSRWTSGWYLQNDSGPGNGLQPIAVGLDGQAVAEYIEIDWSDGVFQTELALQPGSHHRIAETQRQLASCPVLFAWDGSRYRFLSDVLGVGGIGFAVGPGQYSVPRPWEHFRIDHKRLAPRDGAFEIRLTEPMEETAYVDAAALAAYDYPAGFESRLDERMATDGNHPSGEMVFFREPLATWRATNERGMDVAAPLSETDGVAAPPGPTDPRYIGLLAGEHILTLEFDRDLSALDNPVLIMDGWIEYGYSQTSFAAWQAGRSYEPPTLEARDGQGRWHVVASHFGYPAGMPREALYRLPPLPRGARALRIRTNQEIYFDRLAVAEPVQAEVRRTSVPLLSAAVERIGFPQRTNHAQRRPDYDYSERVAFWDTRYQRGFYTALGPATPLVEDADNALAIIGPGDALALRFDPRALPELPEGWTRSFVIRFDGWAKDMDLYTRDGEAVAPLPAAPRSVDRSARLHDAYNTRFLSGR